MHHLTLNKNYGSALVQQQTRRTLIVNGKVKSSQVSLVVTTLKP